MSPFKTFVLPSESDAASEGALNAFLRSRRIVSVAKTYDAGTWRKGRRCGSSKWWWSLP